MLNKIKELTMSPGYSRLFNVLGLLLVVAAIPLTVYLSQNSQDIRKQARVDFDCRDLKPSDAGTTNLSDSNYVWRADCNSSCNDFDNHSDCPKNSSQGEINPETSRWCYGFQNSNNCLQLRWIGSGSGDGNNPTKTPTPTPYIPRDNACRDNPQSAPAGYMWKADCNRTCDTPCPKNTFDPSNVNPDSSAQCYGFGSGSGSESRCIMLVRPSCQKAGDAGCGTSQCQPGKIDKNGACNPACCDADSECTNGQKCDVANGFCNSGKSCNPQTGSTGDNCPPGAPQNLQPQGQISAGQKTLTWNSLPGATKYYLRINDTVNGWKGTCPPNEGDVCETLTTNSYSFTFQQGHVYEWWIQGYNDTPNVCNETGPDTKVSVTVGGTSAANPEPCLYSENKDGSVQCYFGECKKGPCGFNSPNCEYVSGPTTCPNTVPYDQSRIIDEELLNMCRDVLKYKSYQEICDTGEKDKKIDQSDLDNLFGRLGQKL